MDFYIQHTNPHLIGKSESEIMASDIGALNGVSKAEKFYEDFTKRKTHQNYYAAINGEKQLVIRKIFTDIKDVNGNLIDYKIDFYWFGASGKKLYKSRTGFNTIELEKIQENRRKRIQTYLISEAKTAINPQIKLVFSAILNTTQLPLKTWVDSGDASFFIAVLDDTNSPIDQYMSLPTEAGISVKEYLKLFIK